MKRALWALCALLSVPAYAIDINYCQDSGGPNPANCSNQTWIDACNSPAPDPDPCTVPRPGYPNGGYVEEAQEQWQLTHDAPLVDHVFDPQKDDFKESMPRTPRPALTLKNTTGVTGWANQELVAQWKAAQNNSVSPLDYQRVGIFELLNGISSCEDYVYYSFRDVERWLDGINACKDDARCKVNVSLNGYTAKGAGTPPGIARRRPQNLDGNYIYDPTDPKNHMTELVAHHDIDQTEVDPFDDHWQLTDVPKNAFHAGTEYLFPPGFLLLMQQAGVPDPQGLVNILARGDKLYEAGGGVPVSNGAYYKDVFGKLHQGFYDEWDYHHYMNAHTQLPGKTTTPGQWSEYKKRNDAVQAGWAQLADDMKCLWYSGPVAIGPAACQSSTLPSAMGKVRPGDEQIYEQDPFQTWSVMSQVAQIQMAQPPSLFGQIGFGSNLQPAQYTMQQLNDQNITFGSQNIPSGAHAPGLLSTNAITTSTLFGALNLSPSMVANLSAVQIEAIAANEVTLSNILAGQQGLSLLGSGGHVGLLNQLPGVNGLGNLSAPTLGLGGAGLAPTSPTGGAVPFSNTIGGGTGDSIGNCGLACEPPAEFTASDLPPFGLSWFVDRTWQINPPRWTTDAFGAPILNCATSRPRVSGAVNGVDFVGDVSVDSVISLLTVDQDFHTERMWPSLCQLTNLILTEWNRLEAGRPSCLDMGSVACDWKPQDFIDRFVTENVSYAAPAKEIEYTYCKRWTGGGLIMDTAKYPNGIPPAANGCPKVPSVYISGVPSASRQSLTAMREFLDKRRDNFECVLKTVPVKGKDNFGKVKTDGNSLGNDQFGGGYSYTLAWHSCAFRKGYTYIPGSCDFQTPVPTNDPDFGKICRLGGTMNAGFSAFAKMFGQKIDIIDADVIVKANENDDHKGVGWADLTVAGFTVFNAGDKDNPIDLTGSAAPDDLNKMDTEKPQFVEAPFQVGWITVTVKAGILFDYGAKLTLTSVVAQAGDCHVNEPTGWEANATFQPQADLGAWVTVDATLAGMFGVGFELDLVLVGLGLPLTADVKFTKNPDDNLAAIKFDAELDLTLTTLKGELDFYIIAFFAKVASFTIVSWDGFVSKFPIFRTRPVYIDLGPLTPGSIHSPEQTDGSEDI